MKNKIIQLYSLGLSMTEIAKKLNSTYDKINWVLKKAGIKKRKPSECHSKYTFNENFFETIDTEEKAYWLGFIAADGCVQVHSYVKKFSLALAEKDKKHLLKFKKTIDASHPIRSRKGKVASSFPSCVVTLHSPKFIKDLIIQGIIPRKSLTLKPPELVPEELIHHWVRGYFDGDGSIGKHNLIKNYRRISITGTREVLLFIKNKSNLCKINIRPNINTRVFKLQTSRKNNIKNFKKYIYKDVSISLERKKCLFR